ncbi:MAG: hypothetical protein ACE5G6_02945 [Terriglobia bacterium]
MKQKGKLVVLLALVALLVAVNLDWESSSGSSAPASPEAATAEDELQNPTLATPEALLEFAAAKGSTVPATARRRNIFEYAARQEAPPPSVAQTEVEPRPEVPSAPPAPVRFYGFARHSQGGKPRVFLTDGEEIYVAREGELILRRYRIARVGSESIELEDVAGGHRWVVPLEQP